MSAKKPPSILNEWCYNATDSNDVILPSATTDDRKANQAIGFPPKQSEDPLSGGEYVKRNEMNGVFQFYSMFINYMAQGGVYSFDENIANDSGYDAGVVLWSTYYKRLVKSLISSNKNNFEVNPQHIDGISWAFADMIGVQTVPSINVIPDLSIAGGEVVIWAGNSKEIGNQVSMTITPSSDANVYIDFDISGNINLSINRYVQSTANLPISNVQFKRYISNKGYTLLTLKIITTGSAQYFTPTFTLANYSAMGSNVLLNYNSAQIIGNTPDGALSALGDSILNATTNVILPISMMPNDVAITGNLNVSGDVSAGSAAITGDITASGDIIANNANVSSVYSTGWNSQLGSNSDFAFIGLNSTLNAGVLLGTSSAYTSNTPTVTFCNSGNNLSSVISAIPSYRPTIVAPADGIANSGIVVQSDIGLINFSNSCGYMQGFKIKMGTSNYLIILSGSYWNGSSSFSVPLSSLELGTAIANSAGPASCTDSGRVASVYVSAGGTTLNFGISGGGGSTCFAINFRTYS